MSSRSATAPTPCTQDPCFSPYLPTLLTKHHSAFARSGIPLLLFPRQHIHYTAAHPELHDSAMANSLSHDSPALSRHRRHRRPAHPGPLDVPATAFLRALRVSARQISGLAQKKGPYEMNRTGPDKKSLAACYSPMGDSHSTLAVGALHFRVRNGNGCYLTAMATRQNAC